MTSGYLDTSPPQAHMLRDPRRMLSARLGAHTGVGMSRRFWRWQAAMWGVTAIIGIALHGRDSVGEIVFHVLFPATGLAFTSWMAVSLRQRALIPGPSRALLSWSAKHVMISAVIGGAINLLLHRYVLSEPVLVFPKVMWEYLLSATGWALVFGVWLFAFCIRDVFRATARAIEAQQRMQQSMREAEARALRAQLDPHFLFNAINGARSLIGSDPDGARDMLSRYADVLRYATTRGRGLSAILADELNAVESYLEVERHRFSNRMTVQVDVPVEHRGITLPPMLLQTLAENAVRHGVSRLRQGGAVSISSEQQGGHVLLRVENPAPLSTGHDAVASLGIGLSNSRERLALLHGDAASLHIERAPDPDAMAELWTVTVALPLEHSTRSLSDG